MSDDEKRPYYASPWPLKGELQVLAFSILATIFIAVFVLVLLTGCRPILQQPPPQDVGEVQITCIDFSKQPREVPCPPGKSPGSTVNQE